MSARMRIAAGLLAVVFLTAGCLRGSSPTDDIGEDELVWAISVNDRPTHEATAAAWNEANPDRPVRIQWLPPDANEQRRQLFLELNAGSSLFDVVSMDVIWTGEFANNGWIEDLSDLRQEVEGNSLEASINSCTWDGRMWCLPYSSNAGFLYYRTDLVEEPPETWDELMEVGLQAAEEAGIAPYVAQGAQYEGMVVNYLEYFWSAGGEVISEEGDEALYAEGDAARRALEFMRTAQQNGFYAPGYNTLIEDPARLAFQRGDAVFMRNWPYAYPLLSGEDEENPSAVAEDFDIAPLPTFDGEGTISALGGFNVAVNAFSEKKELAREFITFVSQNEDVQLTLGERSLPPTLQSVYETLSDDPSMALLSEVLPEAEARPPVPTYNDISQAMQDNIFPAYNGTESIDSAIQNIETVVEEAVNIGAQ